MLPYNCIKSIRYTEKSMVLFNVWLIWSYPLFPKQINLQEPADKALAGLRATWQLCPGRFWRIEATQFGDQTSPSEAYQRFGNLRKHSKLLRLRPFAKAEPIFIGNASAQSALLLPNLWWASVFQSSRTGYQFDLILKDREFHHSWGVTTDDSPDWKGTGPRLCIRCISGCLWLVALWLSSLESLRSLHPTTWIAGRMAEHNSQTSLRWRSLAAPAWVN